MRKTLLVILGACLTLLLTSSCGKKEEKNPEDPQMKLDAGAAVSSERAA